MRAFRIPRTLAATANAALLISLFPAQAMAFDIDTGNEDIKARFDNTVRYTAAFRMNSPSESVYGNQGVQPNVDFGDRNFGKGMINNRVDLVSELDVSYKKDFGMRVSGAAWYDEVYQRSTTDYPGGAPNNQAQLGGGAQNRLSARAKDTMGKSGEISDAFIYGSTALGDDMKLTGRLGRHTLLYGETLFLGANGIAGTMGPADLIKAFSQPNVQFKEIGLPVNQLSTNLQVNSNLSFGAFYQFEWRSLRLPAAGSYFSPADFVGDGADLLLVPLPGAANRIGDMRGKDNSQFGGRIKFKLPDSDVEYGLYAVHYDDKAPIPIWNVPGIGAGAFGGGTYQLAYARNISAYGASFSTLFGETNVAGEISTRRNTPLAPLGDLILNADPNANNTRNTPYARGNTLHANLSAISVFPANGLWEGASVVGELAYNRLLDVTHNPTVLWPALNSTHTKDRLAARVVFQPEYFQVIQGVDLQVPIGIGYGIKGKSAVFQVAPEHGGDVSIGFNFDYQKKWRAGLNYTHYYGKGGTAPSTVNTYASYANYYRDRDFVSLTVQRTF